MLKLRLYIISILILLLGAGCDRVGSDPVDAEIEQVTQRVGSELFAYISQHMANIEAATPEQRMQLIKQKPPSKEFATEAMRTLIQNNPEHRSIPKAASLLFFSLEGVGENIDLDAVEKIIIGNHINSDDLAETCYHAINYQNPRATKFLRTVFDTTNNDQVRGVAAYGLAQKTAKRGEKISYLQMAVDDLGDFQIGSEDSLQTNPIDSMMKFSNPLKVEAEHELRILKHLSVGQPAPELVGEDLNLQDLRGKLVAVIFWQSDICTTKLPELQKISKLADNPAFSMIGVNSVSDRGGDAFIAKHQLNWVSIRDSGSKAERWGVRQMPVAFLIDQTGVIKASSIEISGVRAAAETHLSAN